MEGPRIRVRKVLSKPTTNLTESDPREELPPPVPTNKEILDRSKHYGEELSGLMSRHVVETREFFLREIFPIALSLTNGFADANDVLTNQLGDSTSGAPLMQLMEGYSMNAIRAKMIEFVSKKFNLNDKEASIYLARTIASDQGFNNARSLETLLHEMQSVANVPRTSEGSEVQLQQLSCLLYTSPSPRD